MPKNVANELPLLPETDENGCGQYAQKLSRLRYISEMLAEIHAMSGCLNDSTLNYFIGMAAMEANQKLEILKFQDVFAEDEI